ncbi:MAG TPA: calcium-binding protein [Solirubrobacteraceae bacterium]|nr:calcium-binding protein [Solirubrobacteraceae bacterium]
MRVYSRIPRRRVAACALATLAIAGAAASTAVAGPGLPRTYDVKRIDSTEPLEGGAFGWGLASADLTGDSKADLLVAQAQFGKGQIFIYDGVTGSHIDTINPPETNDDNSAPVLAFVYVETMPDIGSCPGGDGPDAEKLCDAATIGPGDGIPEIIAGSRQQQVPTTPTGGGPVVRPKLGRGYVFDGRTRAVLKVIDMPLADRQAQLAINPGNQPQFGRMMMSPQGLAPCAGSSAENNAVGVGACPPTGDAVRLGDVDGGGKADIVVTARNFLETPAQAAALSQCRSSGAANCTSGKAWIYRGEDIAGTNPATPLETATPIQNPESQGTPAGSVEFGGNIFRVGDVTGGANGATDGKPDFVITARNADYPLRSPDPAAFVDAGVAFIVNGATGAVVTGRYLTDPQPQPRTQFSGSFNSGRPVGDIGASSTSDILLPAALQNVHTTDDGAAWAFNGDASGIAGGGGEASWQFATLTDPTPMLGGNFGGATTGVGDLVGDFANPGNEVLIGGFNFDPQTEASNRNIGDVHFMNVTMEKNLQTITDPDGQPGSGFGVGLVPMGDLNGDGFLDFAASSYLSNVTFGGQGRAFIFTSNNTPAPAEPTPTPTPTPTSTPTPTPAPTGDKQLAAGSCVQRIDGTGGADKLSGTLTGDMMFALGGDDLASGLDGDDCVDGGSGQDRLLGGADADKLIGRSGDDSLSGGDDNDRLYGSGGRDKLAGGYGRDTLAGGDGDDRLDGGPDADRLFGEDGDDVLIAGDGRNRLDGGDGDDLIRARNGEKDAILCGKGRDVAVVDRNDSVNGCERVRRGS